MSGPAPVRHIVSFVHGIHNAADNYGEILQRWATIHEPHLYIEGIDWGWITGVQMYLAGLIPALDWRRRSYIARQLKAQQNCFGPESRYSVIAHSKGTDLVVDTLLDNPDIYIGALVLVGSVLPNKFHCSGLHALLVSGQVGRVLVVWSPNDSIIKNLSIWPYGKLGATGFVDLNANGMRWGRTEYDDNDEQWPVRQIQTAEEHSTYFWSEFRDQHFRQWADFILEGAAQP